MDFYSSQRLNYMPPESTACGKERTAAEQSHGDKIYASRNENDSRKIFVGGLSWETTSSDLHQYFQQFGEVVDVNLKMNPVTNQSRGFGFVLFKDQASVDRIVSHPKHVLHGRTIDPKRAVAEGSREFSSKVFVGGIDPQMSKEEIIEVFSQYGQIDQIELPFDKEKNERRAFGFITFSSDEAAENVCRNHKVMCGKRKVDVKRVSTKEHKPVPDIAPRLQFPVAPPSVRPTTFQGRGYVDPAIVQTNGMYRSGCTEDEDELYVLQGALDTIAAAASELNFPVFNGQHFNQQSYSGQWNSSRAKRGMNPRQSAPGYGGPRGWGTPASGQGNAIGRGGSVGYHPYNRH